MKFFRKKIVASMSILGAMTILASPIASTVDASMEGTFTVVQGNTTIGSYESRLEAIIEARKWADSKVSQGQGTIWEFGERDNLYRVIQGNTTIAVYENREDALIEARRWANSRIEQDTDMIWAFEVENDLYKVVQGNTTIGEHEDMEDAIAEARRWADSTVVQGDDTVWTFGEDNNLYRVVQGNTTIGVYESVDVARREVRKWAGAQIIQNGEIVEVINFSRPTSGRISSGFGPRWGRMHNGIDIAASTGTPIIASDSGVVTEVTYEPSGYGRKVVIDHQNGYRTLYAHASRTHVRVGQVVSAGDTIASVGSTGRSTGPHLHFEIIENGRRVDPQRYL